MTRGCIVVSDPSAALAKFERARDYINAATRDNVFPCPRPRDSFAVGIADPTFKETGPLFHYRGEARVTYAGEERRNGVACRRYRIDGRGLEGRGGWLWVNKRRGHVEDIEIDLPDTPEWQSFKFRLTRAERMTRARWEQFIKAQF